MMGIVRAILALGCAFAMDDCGSGRLGSQAGQVSGLVAPISLQTVSRYKDGGTMTLMLEDAKGKLLSFCHEIETGEGNGGMKIYHSGRLVTDPSEPLHLYVGTNHPRNPGGQLVPAGGNVDRALSSVLHMWLDKNLSKAEQKNLRESTSAKDRTDIQWKGINVLGWLDILDSRIAQGKEWKVAGGAKGAVAANN